MQIQINDTTYPADGITVRGEALSIQLRQDGRTLEELLAALAPGSAPQVRVLDEEGVTTAIYAAHAVTELALIQGGGVRVGMQVEPLEQTQADALRERMAAQARTIGEQQANIEAQAQQLSGHAALLGAARVAARRTVAADADAMTADELAACAPLFDAWDGGGAAYAVDDIVAYDGALYRCAQAHTSQAGWTPDATRALWTPLGVSADDPEAVPEWVQPTGAHDAYPQGAHVMHNGMEWVSDMDGNVWEPGVSGWTQADAQSGEAE